MTSWVPQKDAQSKFNVLSRPHSLVHELPHDKTNKMACAPSEDSDQPEHPLSTWRKLGPSKLHIECTAKTDQTGQCPGWSESSLGAQPFCWFCPEAAQFLKELLKQQIFSKLTSEQISLELLKRTLWHHVINSKIEISFLIELWKLTALQRQNISCKS